ncbi:hypothetical protein [Roseivirga pacifica]
MSKISREASEKTKGFRLQKLRAIELMLDAIENTGSKASIVYSATEFEEDVYLNNRGQGDTEYFEEDKNYDPETRFTLNSPQVKNTLVSFLDIWLEKRLSRNVHFCFSSTNSYTKERSVKTESGELSFDKPLIDHLKAESIPNQEFKAIRAIIEAEYAVQYSTKQQRVSRVKELSDEEIKQFLSTIRWSFEQADHEELKQVNIRKIKSSKFYNSNLLGKEELVFNSLMELFDEKQHSDDFVERFVHASQVELAFRNIEGENPEEGLDPVWEAWGKMKISDSRNLSEKIRAVCKDFDQKSIDRLNRKVSRSLIEQNNRSHDKSLLSLKYRVFEKCEDLIHAYLKSPSSIFDEESINALISELNAEARKEIKDFEEHYNYNLSNKTTVDGLIMELFDSCYLSFD